MCTAVGHALKDILERATKRHKKGGHVGPVSRTRCCVQASTFIIPKPGSITLLSTPKPETRNVQELRTAVHQRDQLITELSSRLQLQVQGYLTNKKTHSPKTLP